MKKARLENWKVINTSFGGNAYGNIYDDEAKRFEDGTAIKTSKIQEQDLDNNYIKTMSTEYTLGKPKED
jgi:hypothetical protein